MLTAFGRAKQKTQNRNIIINCYQVTEGKMAINESKEGNTNQAGVREGLLEEIVGSEESRTEATRIDSCHQERRESIQKKLWSPCLKGQSRQGQYRARAHLEQDTQGNLGRKFHLTVLWRGSQTGHRVWAKWIKRSW